jgi:hypothetical protein
MNDVDEARAMDPYQIAAFPEEPRLLSHRHPIRINRLELPLAQEWLNLLVVAEVASPPPRAREEYPSLRARSRERILEIQEGEDLSGSLQKLGSGCSVAQNFGFARAGAVQEAPLFGGAEHGALAPDELSAGRNEVPPGQTFRLDCLLEEGLIE